MKDIIKAAQRVVWADLSDDQKAEYAAPVITVGDVRALILVLEAATSHLLLPDEAVKALDRLRKLIERH